MKLGVAGSVIVAHFLIEEHCPTCTLQIFTKLSLTDIHTRKLMVNTDLYELVSLPDSFSIC